jgi:hypothetical protein
METTIKKAFKQILNRDVQIKKEGDSIEFDDFMLSYEDGGYRLYHYVTFVSREGVIKKHLTDCGFYKTFGSILERVFMIYVLDEIENLKAEMDAEKFEENERCKEW